MLIAGGRPAVWAGVESIWFESGNIFGGPNAGNFCPATFLLGVSGERS